MKLLYLFYILKFVELLVYEEAGSGYSQSGITLTLDSFAATAGPTNAHHTIKLFTKCCYSHSLLSALPDHLYPINKDASFKISSY